MDVREPPEQRASALGNLARRSDPERACFASADPTNARRRIGNIGQRSPCRLNHALPGWSEHCRASGLTKDKRDANFVLKPLDRTTDRRL